MCFFSRTGYGPFINPPPSLRNLLLDITLCSISFRCRFFFVNFRLGSVIGLGLGFRIGFGIGNLKNISIGGAAGIVDIPVRKSAVSESELTIPGTKVPGNIQLNSTHQAT